MGQYDRAIASYQQALALLDQAENQARTLTSLGRTHYALGQYEAAILYYERARALQATLGDHAQAGTGWTLHNLGEAYQALSQYQEALGYYEQALEMRRKVGKRAREGTTLYDLGETHHALSQYEPALGFYHQALTLHQQRGDQAEVGRTLSGLAGVYRTLHQYEQALDFYHRALGMRRQAGDRAGEGWTLNGLGEVYRAQGQYPEATTHYEQALALLQAVGHRAGEGRVLHNLMLVWQQRQAPGLAIFYGKQAINVYQQMRGSLRTLEEDLQRSFLASKEKTYRHLAELLMTAGRLPEAQHVLGLLKVAEYADFIGYEAHTTDSLQERLPFTQDEATWQQRYEAITEWRTLLERERRPLLTKLSRTPAEEERLQALEAHRTVAMEAFQHFFTALEPPSSPSTQAQEKLYNLRHARALMADLKELGPGTVALYTLVTDQAYGVILMTPGRWRRSCIRYWSLQ
jgi:tetratricopeptide (TPR) repeat protein